MQHTTSSHSDMFIAVNGTNDSMAAEISGPETEQINQKLCCSLYLYTYIYLSTRPSMDFWCAWISVWFRATLNETL